MVNLLFRSIGKRQIQLFTKWVPSMALFSGAGAAFGLYVTEWRLIVEHIPYYGGIFEGLPPVED